MNTFDRDDYITLVEQNYFGSVMKEDLAGVVPCFTDDCEVVICKGDETPRRSCGSATVGQNPLAAFYEQLFIDYETVVEDFERTIDVSAHRCASNFTVTFTPKPGAAHEDVGPLRYTNSNFFRCRDGKIHAMIVYFANPTRVD